MKKLSRKNAGYSTKNITENEMAKGLFISFEGADGCGKSTQAKLFAQYLAEQGYEVVLTREPGGTPISEKIRNIILDPQCKEENPRTEMLLFAAARAQHVEELIRPSVQAGKIVICDRFVDSSIAYQGYARGLGQQVEIVNAYAIDGCLPEITFFFDISPEEARRRNSLTDKADRLELEKEEFYQKVYEGFIELSKKYADRYVVIDARGSIDDIQQELRNHLNSYMAERK